MKCTEMEFSPSGNVALASFSRKNPGVLRQMKKQYEKVYSPGNGWAYVYQTSTFHLVLESGAVIDVAPFFKDRWGRLTEGRRMAIEATMPRTVTLVDDALKDSVLESWFERAQKVDTSATRKKQRKQEAACKAADLKRWATEEKRVRKEREAEIAAASTLAFVKGWNNKRQCEQWRCRTADGVLHVLCKEQDYRPEEGAVPVAVIRELVPGKIMLVRRL